MQVSAIVYSDSGRGEGWRVSWNGAGYCCSVSRLCERDVTAIRSNSGSQQYYPEHVDDQAMFRTIEEAYAYFHHHPEQWRRAGADQLFSRIDSAKYPGLSEAPSISPLNQPYRMEG